MLIPRPWLLILTALAAPVLIAHAAPVAVVSDDSVTLTVADQTLTASLDDASLSFKSGDTACTFRGSFKEGDGWTVPERVSQRPEITREDSATHVRLVYPLSLDREVILLLDAYDDVPAVFITCSVRWLRSAGAEYYYWQSDIAFTEYLGATPDGPEKLSCDAEKWDSVPWRDWLYFSGAQGGIAVLPTNVGGRAPGESSALFLHALPRSNLIGPGDSHDLSFGLAAVASPEAASELAADALAAHIPALEPWGRERASAPCEYGDPGPDWLVDAEMYNGYYRPAAQWTDELVEERFEGTPFIIGSTPDKTALDRCHKAGVRLLHYVVYTCFLDTEMQAREGGTVYSEWTESIDNEARDLKDHPDWICIDDKGEIQKDAWGQSFHHPGLLNTCLHQKALHDAALQQIRILMELGYDGVFIDLAGPTVECYGDKFGKHTHPDPSRTNTEAYEDLLRDIYATVKSYGDDRIVVQNTCTGILSSHWQHSDVQMLEAFPYGGESDELRPTVPEMRWTAARQADAVAHGKRPLLLPYLSKFTADTVKDGALFSYAYARLYGLLWGDYFTMLEVEGAGEFAHSLYSTRIGKPLSDVETSGRTAYRQFEGGVVALNASEWPETIQVPVGEHATLNDLGYNRTLTAVNGRVSLELAPRSGRVLVVKGED